MAKILLIEDNEQFAKLYQGKLEDEGYEVYVAATGKGGLNLVQKIKPDLIILDIILPGGINGFDVLERLKADNKLKKIPVFVLTNIESEEKVAKEIGATDYAIKAHVGPKDVLERVRKVL